MGPHRYVVDDPFEPQSIFGFVQREGDVSDAEMHRTFNMGTGFVCALPTGAAEALAASTEGRVIGHVEAGDGDDEGSVSIRGLEL
jgi:phosphoribosylformylglycinamidine cyclo-ligase